MLKRALNKAFRVFREAFFLIKIREGKLKKNLDFYNVVTKSNFLIIHKKTSRKSRKALFNAYLATSPFYFMARDKKV